MSNIAKAGSNALAALGGLKNNLVNVKSSIVTPGGDYLLRLVNGRWVYGAENVEVEEGSEWAINPLSLSHGWVAWTDYKKRKNEVLNEVMVPASVPLPAYDSLREVKDEQGNAVEYAQQLSLQLQCLTGEDQGEQVRYKISSVGGMRAVRDVIDLIVKQLDADPDNPVPVVSLNTDTYQHKVWGETHVPVFEVLDWVPLDDTIKAPMKDEEEADPDADLKEEAQPAASRERTRAASATEITDADRRAALNAAAVDAAGGVADNAEPRTRRRR